MLDRVPAPPRGPRHPLVRAGGWALGALLVTLLTVTLPMPSERASGDDGGGLLVIADLRGRALVLFDPARPEQARRVPLPGGPHELATLPDGRVVASLEQAGVLVVVDVATGDVREVMTGGTPHGLVVEGGVLHVTDRERDQVRRFAVASWAELEPLPAGHWPHAVAAGPRGLVVANAGDSTLTMEGRTVAVSALPETVAVAADGRIATAGALGDRVEVFAADGTLLLSREVPGRAVRAAFSSDGRTVAAALSASGQLALLDDAGEVRRVPTGGVPDGLLFDAARGRWFVSDLGSPRVVVVDAARGEVVQVFTFEGASSGSMLWLPYRGVPGGFLCTVVSTGAAPGLR